MDLRHEPIPEDAFYILMAPDGTVDALRKLKDVDHRHVKRRVESLVDAQWELLGYITPKDVHPLTPIPPRFAVTHDLPGRWQVVDNTPGPDSDPIVATFIGLDAEEYATVHAEHLNYRHDQ